MYGCMRYTKIKTATAESVRPSKATFPSYTYTLIGFTAVLTYILSWTATIPFDS